MCYTNFREKQTKGYIFNAVFVFYIQIFFSKNKPATENHNPFVLRGKAIHLCLPSNEIMSGILLSSSLQNHPSSFSEYHKLFKTKRLQPEGCFIHLSAMFQSAPMRAEKTFGGWNIFFSAERFSNLSRMIFQSQPNDFSISAKRFFVLRRMKWRVAEGYLKHPSVYNVHIMSDLLYCLKDERCFCKIPCV